MPVNYEGYQEKAQQEADRLRMGFIRDAELAAWRNKKDGGKIPTSAFRAVVDIYSEEIPRMRAEADAPGNTKTVQEIEDEGQKRIKERISAVNGGKEALKAIREEPQRDSFITPAVKKVYDSDRGGPQWGGIIGLLLGGYLANTVTAGYGFLVNIIATIAGAALFAFVGDNLIDKKPETPQTPDFHSNAPSRGRGMALATEQGTAKSYEEMLAASPVRVAAKSDEHVDFNNINAQNTPKVHKKEPNKGKSQETHIT